MKEGLFSIGLGVFVLTFGALAGTAIRHDLDRSEKLGKSKKVEGVVTKVESAHYSNAWNGNSFQMMVNVHTASGDHFIHCFDGVLGNMNECFGLKEGDSVYVYPVAGRWSIER